MTSLGYSEFSGGSGSSSSSGVGNAYKRKNKTVKAFDSGYEGMSTQDKEGRVNPKLERLKASIAKIHAASSDEDDDDDAGITTSMNTNSGPNSANVLPVYPGQPAKMDQNTGSGIKNNLKISPPIADAGSGTVSGSGTLPPPTTNEGRTHQPMFSMSQQFGHKMGENGNGNGNGIEQFKVNAPSTYAAQYYKQLAPYNYNRLSNELSGPGTNDEFIEKLNYIIHLLEEQHNERTEHVTEELVLYCFLGVFIIFVVDSFARAGKYTR
jgi:hypothetical protein